MRLVSDYLRHARYQMVLPYVLGDVLEIGCGPGTILTWLGPKQRYVGLDSNPMLIRWLVESFPMCEFYLADAEKGNLDLGEYRFDTLLLVAVIEHFTTPANILRDWVEYVREGGRVVLTTPTPVGDRVYRLAARFGIFPIQATEDHLAVLGCAAIKHLFESVGLSLVAYQTFQFGLNQLAVGEKKKR